jgi:hypothetical protein
MGAASLTYRDQVPDASADVRVAGPFYAATHPLVRVDEAHYNFHVASKRFRPFADLLRNDGFRVEPSAARLSEEALGGVDVLVIANALGRPWPFLPGSDEPAFSPDECEVVERWVAGGGALLLIADHAPAGGAGESCCSAASC